MIKLLSEAELHTWSIGQSNLQNYSMVTLKKMLPSGDLQGELPMVLTTPQDGSRKPDAGLSDICLRITAGGSFSEVLVACRQGVSVQAPGDIQC